MQSIRCRCGKIVCQVANLPTAPKVEDAAPAGQGPGLVILCRHCKRYVVLRVPTVTSVGFSEDAVTEVAPVGHA